MQRHTDAPRDGLTEAQVLRLLQGGPQVEIGFGAEVVDINLNRIRDLDLLSGSVRRNYYANIHGTCDLEITDELDWGNDLVRPWVELSASGVTARWHLGAYALTTPENEYGDSTRVRRVQGYDRLYLLSREVGDSWVAPKGAKVLDEVRRAITAAGLTAPVLLDGTKQDVVLENAVVWPLVPRRDSSPVGAGAEDEEGEPFVEDSGRVTTWLRIVNDLLKLINYRGIYADPGTGLYRSEPYVLPAKRAVEHVFDFDDPLNSIVVPERKLTEDRYKAPNHWVFVRSNMPGDVPLEPTVGNGGVYIVDKTAGALRRSTQVEIEAASAGDLIERGNNRVAADERVQTKISVSTAPFPSAGHGDVYRYIDQAMGRNVKVQETEWSLSFDGSDMQRSWEVVG